MTPDQVLAHLGRERAVGIVRAGDETLAGEALAAAVRGGFRTLEITLTTPGVFDLIQDFAASPGLVVGAGTVLDPEAAERAVDAGARFLVSPVTDAGVIAAARSLGVVAIPGGHTPTELLAAHRAGAQLQKVFPAPAGGPAWVRSVLAPLPFLRLVPTNGVDLENCTDWLAAGAFAVGFAASLFPAEDLVARRFATIEERARAIRARLGH
jgi:2-dehydro-3-deoxyphosphogluconate aldolase/(4S)-4-hydroxy-2-oxoglutarate aldolase